MWNKNVGLRCEMWNRKRWVYNFICDFGISNFVIRVYMDDVYEGNMYDIEEFCGCMFK